MKNKFLLRLLLISAFVVSILAALFFLISPFYTNSLAKKKMYKSLDSLGLSTEFLAANPNGWLRMAYNEVSFDKDGVSTVQALSGEFNPLTFFLRPRFQVLIFDKLDIIGAFAPAKTPPLDFSGWTPPLPPFKIAEIPAQRLRVLNSQISLLTPNLGGLTADFDLEGTLRGKKLEFQSHIASAQKYISFTAAANGVIAPGYYNIDTDIEQGKFEVPEAHIRASRIYGWFNLSQDKAGNKKIMAELRAGGMTVLGLPWQNASATLEYKDNALKIFSAGKSLGVEGIELDLNFQKNGPGPAAIDGTLHADDGKILAGYLTEQDKFTLPKTDLAAIKKMQDITIDFTFEKDASGTEKIKYRLNGDPKIHEIILK